MNAYSNVLTVLVSEKYPVSFMSSSPLVGMPCLEFFLPLNSHLLSFSLGSWLYFLHGYSPIILTSYNTIKVLTNLKWDLCISLRLLML